MTAADGPQHCIPWAFAVAQLFILTSATQLRRSNLLYGQAFWNLPSYVKRIHAISRHDAGRGALESWSKSFTRKPCCTRPVRLSDVLHDQRQLTSKSSKYATTGRLTTNTVPAVRSPNFGVGHTGDMKTHEYRNIET